MKTNLDYLQIHSKNESFDPNVTIVQVCSTVGGSSTWYFVPCDCTKAVGGISMPNVACPICQGYGYKRISAEEYARAQAGEQKSWKFCPHCGEKL